MKILIIVESIKKAKTLQKIFAQDKKNEYVTLASMGHVMDLPINTMGIDYADDFKETYVVNPDGQPNRAKCIKEIMKQAKICDKVILASDPDREGEAIAWSLQKMLGLKKPERILFEDTTEKTVKAALKNPIQIDMALVDAQRARRVIDRILGYTLSPILQKNINVAAKSAGRVQSVATRLVYDKENEIKEFFKSPLSSYFKTSAFFKDLPKCSLYEKDKIKHFTTDDHQVVLDFLKELKKSTFKVTKIETESTFRKPQPPFHTATMQQECSSKFGFTAKFTMSTAQKLYENGLITYMRTDSIILSEEILKTTKKYVISEYGSDYHQENIYKNKGQTQEAHECVRPTNITVFTPDCLKEDSPELKLYQLIWKRTVASQMTPAEIGHTYITIKWDKSDLSFQTDIQKIIFKGFLKVYDISASKEGDHGSSQGDDEQEENSADYPIPTRGAVVKMKQVIVSEEYRQPPARYSETTFNQKMHTIGIGRPSTTASILDKILTRQYVEKKNHSGVEKEATTYTLKKEVTTSTKNVLIGQEKNKYTITDMGTIVSEYLLNHFPEMMDYKYTAKIEKDFDQICAKEVSRSEILSHFYEKFKPLVDTCKSLSDCNRLLGKHPDTGKAIYATVSKFGSVIKMEKEEGKFRYAKIKEPLKLKTITLEEALTLLDAKYPFNLGTYNKKQVSVSLGKFGLFLRYGKDLIDLNPIEEYMLDNFTLDEAILIIDEHTDLSQFPTISYKGKEYAIMNGKFGPYLKCNGKNFKILPNMDANNLRKKDIATIIDVAKKRKQYKKKKR